MSSYDKIVINAYKSRRRVCRISLKSLEKMLKTGKVQPKRKRKTESNWQRFVADFRLKNGNKTGDDNILTKASEIWQVSRSLPPTPHA